METTTLGLYRGYIGAIEGIYWRYVGIMEKNMETTILGLYRNYTRDILGLYGDCGKENGNYYSMLGLYGDNGKENGNYYNRLYRVESTGCLSMPWSQGLRCGNLHAMRFGTGSFPYGTERWSG